MNAAHSLAVTALAGFVACVLFASVTFDPLVADAQRLGIAGIGTAATLVAIMALILGCQDRAFHAARRRVKGC